MVTRVVTPPAIEPISVTTAKLHAKVSSSAEDALFSSWITSARELAEGYQNRAYITRTLLVTMDTFPVGDLLLPLPPLLAVNSITYYDKDDNPDTVPATDYFVDTHSEPGRVLLRADKRWPLTPLRRTNAVEVEFHAGYGATEADVPQNVRDALLLYTTYRYYTRDDSMEPPGAFHALLQPGRVVPA